MITLKWNEPKEEFCGPGPIQGAKYSQKGRLFNVHGEYLPREGDEPVIATEEAPEEANVAVDIEALDPEQLNQFLHDNNDYSMAQKCVMLKNIGWTSTEVGVEFNVTAQKVGSLIYGLKK